MVPKTYKTQCLLPDALPTRHIHSQLAFAAIMPFVHISWLPKACRTAKVRQEIADAVMKVMVAHPESDIAKENLVVRFSESVDGFPLPKGHSMNPDLQGEIKPEAEAYLKDR